MANVHIATCESSADKSFMLHVVLDESIDLDFKLSFLQKPEGKLVVVLTLLNSR